MPTLAELLSNSDPEALKKLFNKSDELRMSQPYEQSMANRAATESDYSRLFGKQLAEDTVAGQTLPGKTAADSANVFSKYLGPVSEEAAPMAATAGGGEARSILSRLLGPASKAAGAAGLAYTALGSDELDSQNPNRKEVPVPNKPGYFMKGDEPTYHYGPEKESNQLPSSNSGKSGDTEMSDMISPDYEKDPELLSTLKDLSTNFKNPLLQPDDSKESQIVNTIPTRTPAVAKSSTQNFIDKLNQSQAAPVQTASPISDSLSKLLGQQSQDYEQAKKQRDLNNIIALMGHAGETGAAAIAGSKADYSFWDKLSKQTGQPIEDIQNKLSLQQQGVKGLAQQKELEKALRLQDPNSKESEAFRNVLKDINPGLVKVFGDNFNSITASDKDLIFDLIKLKEQMEMRKEVSKQTADYRKAMLGKKDEEAQKKVTAHRTDLMNTSRMPPAVKQASNDLYASEKALKILDKEDLNKTQSKLTGLVVSEVAKIAKGGVPDKEEFKALTPDTLNSRFARFKELWTGRPQPGMVGEFLKAYRDYLHELQGAAHQVLLDHANNLYDDTKDYADPKSNDVFYKKHIAPHEDFIKKQESGQRPHPQDDAAVKWAKSHPEDPRAARILKANEIQ